MNIDINSRGIFKYEIRITQLQSPNCAHPSSVQSMISKVIVSIIVLRLKFE